MKGVKLWVFVKTRVPMWFIVMKRQVVLMCGTKTQQATQLNQTTGLLTIKPGGYQIIMAKLFIRGDNKNFINRMP